MPVQRWACLAQKLPWRNSCVPPCEIEALSIAAAKHFSPYIIQSKTPACILTDSKPCVQSFEKLCRGEFSSSPRVATFLSTVSRYQASVHHVAGAAMLPSDFASRNAPKCDNPTCQVCSFIQRTEDSVVLCTSVQSILSGTAKLLSLPELLGLPSRQSVQTYGALMPILLKAMPFQEVDRH